MPEHSDLWQRAANYNHRITLRKVVTASRGKGGRRTKGEQNEDGVEEWTERVKRQRREKQDMSLEAQERMTEQRTGGQQ